MTNPTAEEIRGPLYRADHDGPIYHSDMQTLAAAYCREKALREELTEALFESVRTGFHNQESLQRYGAVLAKAKEAKK